MRFISSVTAAALALASIASAAQFNVEVGKDNTNVFDPPFITGVAAGDTITFRFTSKSHSVTQSTFDKPCVAKEGGVDSGFQTVDAASRQFPEWTIQIDNVTTPHWFYCAREPHCSGAGMVFAINPTEQRSFATFQGIARGQIQPNATSPTTGAGTGTGSTPAATGTGAAAGNAPGNTGAASSLSVHKAVTALAAIAVVAGISL
jgi:plastocyanin